MQRREPATAGVKTLCCVCGAAVAGQGYVKQAVLLPGGPPWVVQIGWRHIICQEREEANGSPDV